MNYNNLPAHVPTDLNQIVQNAVNQALSAGLRPTHMQRAAQEANRVYHRPNETVYENVRTTVEIYHFQ